MPSCFISCMSRLDTETGFVHDLQIPAEYVRTNDDLLLAPETRAQPDTCNNPLSFSCLSTYLPTSYSKMRNLNLLTEKRHKIHVDRFHEQTTGECFIHFVRNPLIEETLDTYAQDDSSAIYYYALLSTGEVIAINCSGSILWNSDLSIYKEYNAARTTNLAESDWFSLTYVDTADHLVALSHGGSIATIDSLNGKVEIVGSFENGIVSGSWSSDSELLCLVTHQSMCHNDDDAHEVTADSDLLSPVVIIMNCHLDILVETNLPSSVSSEPIFMSWKSADNSLIAVSSVDKEDGIRRIRIFDVTTLSNMVVARSEDGSGKLISNITACNIAWAGLNCSNLLAAVQKRGRHGWEVVFIESNGLQHGSFKLRTVEGDTVECINWNSDSDLLVVVIANVGSGDISRNHKCQLYHRSNYHWYLKREVPFDCAMSLGKLEFDRLKTMTLLASLYHRGSDVFECREYDFSWNFSVSQNGTVAVIDGSSLNITHLNKAVIPPPLYAYSLVFEGTLSEVHFTSSYLLEERHMERAAISVHAIASSYTGSLLFLGRHTSLSEGNDSTDGILSILAVYKMSEDLIMKPYSSCLRQYLAVEILHGEDEILIVKLLALASATAESESWCPYDELFVMTFRIDFGPKTTNTSSPVKASLDQLHRYKLQGQGIRLSPWIDYHSFDTAVAAIPSPVATTALVQLSDGRLFEYSSESKQMESLTPIDEPELMFLEPCPTFSGIKSCDGKRLILGISKRCRLYMGERLLHEAVSSFYLSSVHKLLAFSTLGSRPQLYFLPIRSLFDFDPLSSLEDTSFDGYEARNLERGSVLLSVFPDRPEAVFLLPRGNLELLCPRGLLIPFVIRLLQQGKYAEAFSFMRKQKIDVNLLCDVNPTIFLKQGGIEKFLEQVKSMDHVNLFIAGLSNIDVTAAKYPILDWFGSKTNGYDSLFDFSTKINQICSKMRSAMIAAHESGMLNARKISPGEFLLPILSTYAKEEPPQLEKALLLIKVGDDQPSRNAQKTKSFNEKTQGAITYLAFLSNYELLFDTALGLYDFDMAKAVARNSQLDPKQYLPLLKHYKEIPKYKARYEVDLRLRRYESALRHMILYHEEMSPDDVCDDQRFSECLNFIEEHKLHRLALELFSGDNWKQRKVTLSLGNMMFQEGKYENALAIFLSITDPIEYPSVLLAARKCRDWQSYFTYHKLMTNEIVTEKQLDVKELASMIAKEISEAAFDKRRSAHAEAARILLDYGDDVYNAIEYLISGELWFEARRLSVHHGMEALRMKVKDEANLSAENCIAELGEKKEAFEKAMDGFVCAKNIRRESKRNALNSHLESDGLDDTGSLFSLASNASNTSKVSMRSNMSTSSKSSMSSVISAGRISTFSIVESRSIVNPPKPGQKKSRKSRSKAEKKKIKPGSEEELINLINVMKASVTDDLYAAALVETLKFLSQESLSKLADDLFQAYITLQQRVNDCIKTSLGQPKDFEENRESDPIIVSYEAELMALKCADLPPHFHDTFSYLNYL